MSVIRDVHTTHCCPRHGCKYATSDECTVLAGHSPIYDANNGCEICADEGYLSTNARHIVLDRLGEEVDRLHREARVRNTHDHGDWEAVREAADFIWKLREELK